MIILGVNTSSDVGAIGLIKGSLLLGELVLEMRGASLQRLLPAIDYVLRSTQLTIQDVGLFTVVLGPGSWSGLRIGVTTLKCLACALKKPVVGISALDALAYNLRFADKLVYPTIDAKRGQIYFAGYRCQGETPERFTDYRLSSVEEFLNGLESPAILLGDGSLKYKQKMIASLGNRVSIAPSFISQISGAFVAEAGLHKYIESGANDAFSLAPLYLQKSSAEITWDMKRARDQ